ncbi:toprim domain-containing protein [Sneathiella chinensis]|uniref:Toprim domain-containing protein n=1 Tax=Sneathiella chinensis TaxID=349750 RepID=A0ABQ5U2H8_9PROT|nr:toprim domain-containing protein [Sneathiella chinensis]GLQ05870.1 hypothetical protein GCM10007924_10910 [Sneathiella chinensis]
MKSDQNNPSKMFKEPFHAHLYAYIDKRAGKKTAAKTYQPPIEFRFIEEMHSYGFTETPSVIVRDKIQRLQAPGDKKCQKSGWYIYFEYPDSDDPTQTFALGVFGSWRGNPEKVIWTSKSRTEMTSAQIDHIEAKISEAREAQEKERLASNELVAVEAEGIIASGRPADVDHPYLVRKQIKPFGIVQVEDSLVVPVICSEDGEIISVQYIDQDGSKRFLKGGRTKGGCFQICGDTEKGIYICEGYATGASIAEATGGEVYAAFNANNLKPVHENVQKKHPGQVIHIAGDDDCWTDGNPGRMKAQKITGAQVIFPIFQNYENGKPTDFNDLHVREGLLEVQKQLSVLPLEQASEETGVNNRWSKPFPEHCLKVDGLMGEVCNWINRTALVPQPVLTLGATLVMFAGLFGRRYNFPNTNTHTNLFVIGVAASGGGKDHARKCIKSILSEAELGHLIAGGEFTSGAALKSALWRNPVLIAFLDEFGKYLAATTGRNASSYQSTFVKNLMEFYSDSGSVHNGTEYSIHGINEKDRPKRQDIYNPSINVYGTTTPSTLFDVLRGGDVLSGFLNRMLVFEGNERASILGNSLRNTIDRNPPENLVNRIRQAYLSTPEPQVPKGSQLAEIKPILRKVRLEASAITSLEDIVHGQEEKRLDGKERFPDLWVRAFENTVKLAMIRAICDDPKNPVILVHHVEWARDIVWWCIENMSLKLEANLSDSQREKNSKEILQFISQAGKAGRTRAEITRKFQRMNKRDRDEILEELIEIGSILSQQVSMAKSKKPTQVFVVT